MRNDIFSHYEEYLDSTEPNLTPLAEAVLDLIAAEGTISKKRIGANKELNQRFPVSLVNLSIVLDSLEWKGYIREKEKGIWEIKELGRRYFTEY